jgi:hypothetical protein
MFAWPVLGFFAALFTPPLFAWAVFVAGVAFLAPAVFFAAAAALFAVANRFFTPALMLARPWALIARFAGFGGVAAFDLEWDSSAAVSPLNAA